MTVAIERAENGTWRLYLVPSDDIEREIIKQIGTGTTSLVKDVKLHNSHIPDCLIVEQRGGASDTAGGK